MNIELAYARCTAYATAGVMFDLKHLPDGQQRRIYRESYLTLSPAQRRDIDHIHQQCAGVQRDGQQWTVSDDRRNRIRSRVARALGDLTPASEVHARSREHRAGPSAASRAAGPRSGSDPGDDDPHSPKPDALGLHASPALLQARIRKNISGTTRALIIEEFVAGVLAASEDGPLYVRVYDGDEVSEPNVDLLLVVHVGDPTGDAS